MKRANGTGTIVKLKGNRRKPFLVKVPGRDEHGYIVQRPLDYFAKLSDAQQALDDFNAKQAAGVAPKVSMLNYTVAQVYDGWSGREYKRLEKQGSTSSITSHKAAWNKRVSRYAERKMRSVTLEEWQSILDEDEDAGLSQSTINNDASLIRALYAHSMKHGIVERDLSPYLEVPTVDPKVKKGALNDIQLTQLEKLATAGTPWADTALMLCYTGLRITEFLTLTQFSYNKNGEYLQCGIKSAAGRNRIIPVHPKIKPYLMRWLSKGGETIICDETGRPIPTYGYRDNIFKPLMHQLGLDEATPHWCRHTFATQLHAAGVDELTRKLLLGHSIKGDVTDRYTHPNLKLLTEAVRKIA